MNKSNEEMKIRHTPGGSHTEISSIPIFVIPLKFLHSCGHWNTDHVKLVSRPISVTILTNCSMCCDIVACVCFNFNPFTVRYPCKPTFIQWLFCQALQQTTHRLKSNGILVELYTYEEMPQI